MKVRKILLLVLSVCMLAVLLASCGGQSDPKDTGTETENKPVTFSVPELAASIAKDGKFSEELTENKPYLEKKFPQLDGAFTDCMAYVPAGITPEEVFVYKANTEADVSKIKDALNGYVEQQKADYADYAPAQVPKLDAPVIESKGVYVVYVISEDNAAAQTLVKGLLG